MEKELSRVALRPQQSLLADSQELDAAHELNGRLQLQIKDLVRQLLLSIVLTRSTRAIFDFAPLLPWYFQETELNKLKSDMAVSEESHLEAVTISESLLRQLESTESDR